MSNHFSTKAVTTAVLSNGIVAIAKFIGFLFSGSSAMLAETIHSVADTANQGLLLFGLKRSRKKADKNHHFGYGQETYFWNLVSAIIIFFLGFVYTLNHSIEQLLSHKESTELSIVAFFVIGISMLVEGYSWYIAYLQVTKQRKENNMSLREFLFKSKDPATLAVLVEDTVAIIGLFLAFIGMGLTEIYNIAVFDIVAALLISFLMGGMAIFLAKLNKNYLLNKSEDGATSKIVESWKNDARVQSVCRADSIVISQSESILMAEIELCEEKLMENMSHEEIKRAIKFMAHLNMVRNDLEALANNETDSFKHHIFVEFILQDSTTGDKQT